MKKNRLGFWFLTLKGNPYGTTYEGGAFGYGSVFELTPEANGDWSEKVLYSFNGTDGR